MKTLTHFLTTTHKSKWKPLKLFSKTGLSDWPSLLSFSEPLYYLIAAIRKSNLFSTIRVLASPALASLVWMQSLVKSTMLNGRIYLALVLFCASPFGFSLHTFFERKVVYESMGFIENWFHLFNMIGPYIFALMVSVGFCLMIPPKQKTVKAFRFSLKITLTRIASIPVGLIVSKIIWLCCVTSNDDFFTIPNWSFFIGGFLIGYVIYSIVEYLTWRKYHAFDGLVATIEGLYQIEISEDVRKEKVLPLLRELKEFHSKY
jgi:hypothetical protein